MDKPHDPIAAMRAKLTPGTTPKIATARERREITFDPDARKARDLVKKLNTDCLAEIARELPPILGDMRLKEQVRNAYENFIMANADYCVTEEKPTVLLTWPGAGYLNHGFLPTLSAGAPEHKINLVSAWNAMLIAVNEATKVGVTRRSRFTPIELQADIDASEPVRVQVQGADGWDN